MAKVVAEFTYRISDLELELLQNLYNRRLNSGMKDIGFEKFVEQFLVKTVFKKFNKLREKQYKEVVKCVDVDA